MAAPKVALLLLVSLFVIGSFSSAQGYKANPASAEQVHVCHQKCSSTEPLNIVCDNDAKVYRNRCELNNAICRSREPGYALGTKSEAYCDPKHLELFDTSSLTTETPPTTKKNFWFDKFCSVPKPICDTLGNIHLNHCKFHEAMKLNPDLKLSDEKPVNGTCRRSQEYGVYPGELCVIPCPDPVSGAQVCDQHGRSYPNSCELENAQCENPDLKISPCPGTTRTPIQAEDVTKRPTAISPCAKKECPPVYDPICDQHGHILANLCEFENHRDCADPDAKRTPCPFVMTRKCESPCTRNLEPTCDQYGSVWPNECEFENGKRCKDSSIVKTPCPSTSPSPIFLTTCETTCTSVRKTVCDQYAHTYRNPCEFKKAKCQDRGLQMKRCPAKLEDDFNLEQFMHMFFKKFLKDLTPRNTGPAPVSTSDF